MDRQTRERRLALAGPWLLGLALGLLVLAVHRGELEFGFLLIIPFLHGTGPLAGLAFIMLMSGLTLTFLFTIPFWKGFQPFSMVDPQYQSGSGPSTVDPPQLKPGVRQGGLLFIGPLPILWGTDSLMAKLAMAIGLGVLVVWLVVILFDI